MTFSAPIVCISFPYKVGRQWWYGQEIKVGGKRVVGPTFFGPFPTKREATDSRTERLRALQGVPR